MSDDDGDWTPEPRRPGPRRYDGPKRRVNAVVANGILVEVFDALCALEGRRPHQLVHDIVRDHLDKMSHDPYVQAEIRILRAARLGLTVIEGGGPTQP